MNYIKTKEVEFKEKINDFENIDPYVWLEKKDNIEVIEWVKKQNEFTDEYFKNYNVSSLEKELKNDSCNISYYGIYELNSKLFASKVDENGKHSAVILDTKFNELEIIADENTFDIKYCIFSVVPSVLDNGICILSAIKPGASMYTVIVYDYKNKKSLKIIENLMSFVWSRDGKKLYYAHTQIDFSDKTNKNSVRTYNYATDETHIIYEHKIHSPYFILSSSKDGQYVFINAKRDYATNELLVLKESDSSVKALTGSHIAKFNYLGTANGKHFVLTDDNAPFGKIVAIDEIDGDYNNAVTVISETDNTISGAFVTENYLIVVYMTDVASELKKYSFDGVMSGKIDLPDNMGTVGGLMGLSESTYIDSNNIYFEFESFVKPPTILKFNPLKYELSEVYKSKKVSVPDDIVVTRQFITARDGQRVHAYIVHKKDVKLDGNNPTLMYGYGGYNYAILPSFNNSFIGLDVWKWVNRGYVYVNCNIRGGGEYGSEWHRAGNLDNKKNVFNDFIDITEWMIDNKWTRPEKIAICGGSNGGLLMTALITMRPDLWSAVIASVPHTDMIRFMNDATGPMYITEYGDPRKEDMTEYMASYSPYHNVKAVNYPAIYIQTGEMDNNVPPYHGKKFAAKMQKLNKSENPVLLRVLAEGSHDRGSGDVMFKTTAEMQTFINIALKLTDENYCI